MAFFVVILKLQIFHYDFKICEAEVTLTPLINKICEPCGEEVCYNPHFVRLPCI